MSLSIHPNLILSSLKQRIQAHYDVSSAYYYSLWVSPEGQATPALFNLPRQATENEKKKNMSLFTVLLC